MPQEQEEETHGPKPDTKADKKGHSVPPNSGAPTIKKVGNTTYKWCGKAQCKWWTTTQDTTTHTGKSPNRPGAHLTSQPHPLTHDANTFLIPNPSA